MKFITAFIFLLSILPVVAFATEITFNKDTELISVSAGEEKAVMTIKAGEKFSFDRIEGDWVYGAYTHEHGITHGKAPSTVFKEQFFLRRKASQFRREMKEKGMVEQDGKWISLEEIERKENEARGLVIFEGKWITPEERDQIIAQREAEEDEAANAIDPLDESNAMGNDIEVTGSLEGDDSNDAVEITDPFAGGIVEPDGPSGGVDNADANDGPEIEDLAENEGDDAGGANDATSEEKKGIDWTKTSGSKKKQPANTETDDDKTESSSPQRFAKYILPVLGGMGVFLLLILVLSSRKGKR